MSTATSDENVADDDDETRDDAESQQPSHEGAEDWTVPEDGNSNKLWIFGIVGLLVVFVLWIVWRSKHDEVKQAAAPVLKNLHTGASQAQDLLGTAWDKAGETSSQVAHTIAGSQPVRTAASAVSDAPSAIADSLDELSHRLREQNK